MIYRQTNTHLRYKSYPISAHVDVFDPKDGGMRRRTVVEDGTSVFRFCSLHNHMAMELILVERGRIRAFTEQGMLCVEAGDILIFNPLEVHKITSWGDGEEVRYLVINFDLSVLRSKGGGVLEPILDDLETGKLRFDTLIGHNCREIDALAEHIRAALTAYIERAESPALYMHLLAQLLGVLSLLCEGGRLQDAAAQKLSRDTRFSQKVVRYVNAHYAESISTEQVAAHLHFNKSYFCRAFRQVFGQSFLEYLNEFRISLAKSLSVRDYGSLASIAEAVGYHNYTVFAKHFRQLTGEAPKDYYR